MFNPKGPYLCLDKGKETFCVVFTYSVKRVSEITKFHVAVRQGWQKNVQKSVMHVQSCCFTNVIIYTKKLLNSDWLRKECKLVTRVQNL